MMDDYQYKGIPVSRLSDVLIAELLQEPGYKDNQTEKRLSPAMEDSIRERLRIEQTRRALNIPIRCGNELV